MGWTMYCALLILGVATLTVEAAPTQLDSTGADEPLVVCYFSSWAVYRPGDGRFDVDDIDPNLCTHLVFGFTGLSNWTWTIQVLDPWNELCPDDEWANGEGNGCAFDRFNALRNQNPNLKTTVAVGGWNEGSTDYSIMARDPLKRKTFVESVIELVVRYDFDGFDFDWEYPAARGGIPEDKENFILVLDMLRYELDQFTPKKILTSALAAGKPTIDPAYDIPGIIRNFDLFHIMAYDYHGAFEDFTHHNAPLCKYYLDEGNATTFNVEFTVNYYIELGLDPAKMTMGLATYGRCFILDDINENGMLAPAHQAGPPGPYTRMPGSLGFNEICERFVGAQADDTCTIVNDPALHEPYFYCTSDRIWCGYDDEESILLKARFAHNKGLGGVIVWTVDTDDFIPKCYSEPFHLIRSAREAWKEPLDPDYEACIPYNPDGSSTTDAATTPEATTAKPTTASATTASATTDSATTASATTASATTASPTTASATTASATTASATTAAPTTASPTTADPTTASPTTTPSTTTYSGPCPPGTGDRPDCNVEPEGSMFPHYDCNKYWECEHAHAILNLCPPGTMFDAVHGFCNWQDQVDTTCCRQWDCSIDNTYYPAEDCDKYYRCYNGEPHLEQCPNCLFWNQGIFQCDTPMNVDSSQCTIPDYCY